ncbi:hypothetical protein D922_03406 [Enterococcus faecalis 06-MB-DW-09]|nr:hypothetical protein D922_03406 [Enterococcus faecalis 06-MB-DW-09]
MKAASFTDGNISHTVHTRAEALHLIDRYWPEEPAEKMPRLIDQLADTLDEVNIPHIIILRDDEEKAFRGSLRGEPREIAELTYRATLGLVDGLTEEAPE